jgi:hypothetical protein
MNHDSSPRLCRLSGLAALCVMVLGLLTIVSPANARVFFGIGVPLPYYAPGYYPPPVYYPPPPVYYAPPPPVVYTPPQPAAPAYGQSCNAGAYVCPLDRPMAPGSACYCLGNGGGRVGGRVN